MSRKSDAGHRRRSLAPRILTQTAIRRAGSGAALARVLGVSRQYVHQWGEHVPALQAFRLRLIRPDWCK